MKWCTWCHRGLKVPWVTVCTEGRAGGQTSGQGVAGLEGEHRRAVEWGKLGQVPGPAGCWPCRVASRDWQCRHHHNTPQPVNPPACLPARPPTRRPPACLQPHLCVEAVDGLPVLALLLEGSKHAVPDDQDASVVPASTGCGARGQGRCVNLVGCNRSQQQTRLRQQWLAARQAEHGRLRLPAAAAAAATAGARGRRAHLRP